MSAQNIEQLEADNAQLRAEVERLKGYELDMVCIMADVHDYCKDLKADRSRGRATLVATMIGNLRAERDQLRARVAELERAGAAFLAALGYNTKGTP